MFKRKKNFVLLTRFFEHTVQMDGHGDEDTKKRGLCFPGRKWTF